MTIRSITSKALVMASSFFVPLIISPPSPQLSLRHGIYVLDGISCKGPPFAAMQSWDGVGFAGPHASQCTTRILSNQGNHFDISTACAALGDGTPDRSGHVTKVSLTQLSNTRFVVELDEQTRLPYRWCSAG